MTLNKRKLIACILIIIGFVLNGMSWSMHLGHPINTIFLILGILFIIGGFMWLIVMK